MPGPTPAAGAGNRHLGAPACRRVRDCLVALGHVIVSGSPWSRRCRSSWQPLRVSRLGLGPVLARGLRTPGAARASFWHREAAATKSFASGAGRCPSRWGPAPGPGLAVRRGSAVEDLSVRTTMSDPTPRRRRLSRCWLTARRKRRVVGVIELLGDHPRAIQDDEITMLSTAVWRSVSSSAGPMSRKRSAAARPTTAQSLSDPRSASCAQRRWRAG